jgi:hypothetical protein
MPSNSVDLRAAERAVIIEAGNLVARSARSRVAWSTKIRNAISLSEVTEWQNGLGIYVKVDLNQAPMARAFERGSGLHDRRGARYIMIAPKNTSQIVFEGTNAWKGQIIRVPPMGGGVVYHPGVAARPYLAPAVQENRAKIREILSKAVRTSVSRTIRTAWYQGKK